MIHELEHAIRDKYHGYHLYKQLEQQTDDTYKTLVLRYRTPQQATPFWIAMHDEMEHAIRLQGYMYWFDERS